MPFVEKGDLKAGFWIGLGVIGALFIWGLLAGLAARAKGAL